MNYLSSKVFKLICWTLIAVFALETVLDPRTASAAAPLMAPSAVTNVPAFAEPVLARGLQIHPENPLRFDFYLDTGKLGLGHPEVLREETNKLIKYFMAALTIPDQEQWVNLSPIEPDKIVNEGFGQTRMGRDLLAQDYILKKMSSDLTNPDGEFGRAFWDKVYQAAYDKFGTTDVPLEANHRIWIMPDSATVYESGANVFILDRKMKVMLEDDVPVAVSGLRPENIDNPSKAVGKQIARDILVPAVEKEVNSGAAFAELRQIYSAMILATWFKRRLKNSLLSAGYADRRVVAGVDDVLHKDIEGVYKQYLDIYREGAYNMIREEYDPATQTIVPRKYFSGGFTRTDAAQMNLTILSRGDVSLDSVVLTSAGDQAFVPVEFKAPGVNDAAMLSKKTFKKIVIGAVSALVVWFAYKNNLLPFFNSKPDIVRLNDRDANAQGEFPLFRGLPLSRIDTTGTRTDGQDWDKISSELGNMNENIGYVYSAVTSLKMWDRADQLGYKIIQGLPDRDLTLGNWTDADRSGQRQRMKVGIRDRNALAGFIEKFMYKNGVLRPSVDFLALGNEYNLPNYSWKSAPMKAEYFKGIVKNPEALIAFLRSQGFIDAQGNFMQYFDTVFNEDLLQLYAASDKTWFDQGPLIYGIMREMHDRGEWYELASSTAQWLHQKYPDLPVGIVWGAVPTEASLILLKDINIWGMNIYNGEVEGLWRFRQQLMDLNDMGFDMKGHQIVVTESGIPSLYGKVYQAEYNMNLYRDMEKFYSQFPDLFRRILFFEKYNEYWKAQGGDSRVQDADGEEHYGAAEASGQFKPFADSLKGNWNDKVWRAATQPWYQDAPEAREARQAFLENMRRVANQRAQEGLNLLGQKQVIQYWSKDNPAGRAAAIQHSETHILSFRSDQSQSSHLRQNFRELAENDKERPEVAFKYDAAGNPEVMYFFTGLTLEKVEAMDLKHQTIRRVDEHGDLTDMIGTFRYVDQNRVVRYVFGKDLKESVSKYVIEQRRYPSGALWRVIGVENKGFTNLWYYPKKIITENGVKVDGQVILGYQETRERAVFYYIDHPDDPDPSRRYQIVDRFGKPLGENNRGNWAGIATTTPYLVSLPESLKDFEKNRAVVVTQLVDYKRNPIAYYWVDALSDQVLAEGEGVFDGKEYVRFLVDRNQLNPELSKASKEYGTYFFRLDGDVFKYSKAGDISKDEVVFNSAEGMFNDLKNIPAYKTNGNEIRKRVVESLQEISRHLTGDPQNYTKFKLVRRLIQTPEGHQEYSYGILNDDYDGRAIVQVSATGKAKFQSALPKGFGPGVMADVVVNEKFDDKKILVATVFSHTGERILRVTELDPQGNAVKYTGKMILDKSETDPNMADAIRKIGNAGVFADKKFHRITSYLLMKKDSVPVADEYIGETDERAFVKITLGTSTFTYLSDSPAEFAKVPWRATSQSLTFDTKYKIPLGVTRYTSFDETTGEYVSLMKDAIREEQALSYPVELRFDPQTGIVSRKFSREEYSEATRNGIPVWVARGSDGQEALFSKPEVRIFMKNNQTYMMINETTISSTRREEERAAIYRLDESGQFQWYATYLQDPNTKDDRWDVVRYKTEEFERGFNSLVPNKQKTELNALKRNILQSGEKVEIKNIHFSGKAYIDWFRWAEQHFYYLLAALSVLAVIGKIVFKKRRPTSVFSAKVDKAMLTQELKNQFSVATILHGRLVIPRHIPSMEEPAKRKEFLEFYLRGYGIAENQLDAVIALYESGEHPYLFEDSDEDINNPNRIKALDISAENFTGDLKNAVSAGYAHALIVNDLIQKNLVTVADAQRIIQIGAADFFKSNPNGKPGRAALWDVLSSGLIHKAQDRVLQTIKDGKDVDQIKAAIKNLPQTPEARVLGAIVEYDVLSMEDIIQFARKTNAKGESDFVKLFTFVDDIFKEKIIGKISENILQQMGISFVYDPADESSDKRLVMGTIYARAHTRIFRNPQVLKSLAGRKLEKDPLADIEYNPYRFNDFLETKSVRLLAINSFLKANPSQTKGLSFGGGSLMATYLVYASMEIEEVLQREIKSAGGKISEQSLGAIQSKIQTLDKSYGALLITMMKDGRKAETDVDGRKAFENVTDRDEDQNQRLFEVFSDQQIFNLFAWMVRDGLKFGELAEAFDKKMDSEGVIEDDPWSILKTNLNKFRFHKVTNDYGEENFVIQLEKYLTSATPKLRAQVYAAMQLMFMDQFGKHDPEATKAFENTQKLHTINNRFAFFTNLILTRFKTEIIFLGLVAQYTLPVLGGLAPFTLMLALMLGLGVGNFSGSSAGVALKQILWDHYLKIFGNLEKFWNVKSAGTRGIIHYASMGTFIAGFGLAIASSFGFAPVLTLYTWVYTLLATLPSILLPVIFADNKIVSKQSKWYWGLVLGLSATLLFGLLPHHLFPYVASLPLGKIQTLVTLFLVLITVMPTITSVGQVMSFKRSYSLGQQQLWSLAAKSIAGIKSLDPRRIDQQWFWRGKFKQIYEESLRMEDESGFLTLKEPVASYLQRTFQSLFAKKLITETEYDLYVKALRQEPDGAFVLPKSKEASVIVRDVMKGLALKKPIADPVALIESTSTHVQAAWETFSYSVVNFMFNGLFNPNPKTGEKSNPAGYMMHRLVEWQDVVDRMRAKFEKGRPEYKSLFDQLAKDKVSEYTDLIKLLYMNDKLNVDDVMAMDQTIRDFLNEHQQSNISVAQSMGQDILEYHINIARQTGDIEYAQAVTELSQREGYVSLKRLYEDLSLRSQNLSEQEKIFFERYQEYHRFVKSKLRHMLHVEPLWRTFEFDANRNIVKAPPVDNFRNSLVILQDKLKTMPVTEGNNSEVQELERLIATVLKRPSITVLEENFLKQNPMSVEKWARMVQDENTKSSANDDPRNIIRLIYLARKHVSDEKFVEGIRNSWNQIEDLTTYLKTLVDNDILYSLYSPKDSVIERNKNGGMSHNLWLFFETTFNYDAYNRPTHGSSIWRPLIAATFGRNPHIAVINPKMRVWEAASEIWPGTSVYAISQESFTGPVQRGQFEGTSFYGKGIGRTEIIVTLVSPPGEDTASFLEVQRLQPLNTSSWVGWYEYIWGRPSLLIESMIGTETRYSFNSIRLMMDPGQHGVMFQKNLGFDKKLSHYFFFLHYMNSFNVMLLLTIFPALVGTSHFQYLTPFWMFAFVSTFLMQAINLLDFMRHWEDTGSFYVAAAKTVWDIIRGFGFYVTLLPNFLIGKILSGNEVFSFIRTRKDALLGAWNDLEKFKETMMVDFSPKFREGLPLKGLIGMLGVFGFAVGAFMMHGKGISLIAIYGLASVAVLTGVYVYGAFSGKDGKLRGMDGWQFLTKIPLVMSLTLQYTWPVVDRFGSSSKYLSAIERVVRQKTALKTLSPYQLGLQMGVARDWTLPLWTNALWYVAASALFISGWLFIGLNSVVLFFGSLAALAVGMFIGGLVGGVTVDKQKKIVNVSKADIAKALDVRKRMLAEVDILRKEVRKAYPSARISASDWEEILSLKIILDQKYGDLGKAKNGYKDLIEKKKELLRNISQAKSDVELLKAKLALEYDKESVIDPAKKRVKDVKNEIIFFERHVMSILEKAGVVTEIRMNILESKKQEVEFDAQWYKVKEFIEKKYPNAHIPLRDWNKLKEAVGELLKGVEDENDRMEFEKTISVLAEEYGFTRDELEQKLNDVGFYSDLSKKQQDYRLQFLQTSLEELLKKIEEKSQAVKIQHKGIKTDKASLNAPGGIIMDSNMLNLKTTGSSLMPVIQNIAPAQSPFIRLDYIILDIRPVTSLELMGRLKDSEVPMPYQGSETKDVAVLLRS